MSVPKTTLEIRIAKHGLHTEAMLGYRSSAIRLFCLECMGGNRAEVVKCSSPHCALFPFRFGHTSADDLATANDVYAKAMRAIGQGRPMQPAESLAAASEGLDSYSGLGRAKTGKKCASGAAAVIPVETSPGDSGDSDGGAL